MNNIMTANQSRAKALQPIESLKTEAYRVLDAQQIRNTLDWNQRTNRISVALKDELYIYHPIIGQSYKLIKPRRRKGKHTYTLGTSITAVTSSPHGNFVAVGSGDGIVSVWDIAKKKCITKVDNDTGSDIGILNWSRHWGHNCVVHASPLGKYIFIADLRHKVPSKLYTHTNATSFEWSRDLNKFAVGGHTRLSVFDVRNLSTREFGLKHISSIKGIAWSPHNSNVLISGDNKGIHLWDLGCDRIEKFRQRKHYNSCKGMSIRTPNKSIQTRSQICNIVWNPFKSDEILTTNGDESNDINIWNVNQNKIVKTLRGHTERVLCVALSADKKDIATASNDGTLRLWNVFSDTNNLAFEDEVRENHTPTQIPPMNPLSLSYSRSISAESGQTELGDISDEEPTPTAYSGPSQISTPTRVGKSYLRIIPESNGC